MFLLNKLYCYCLKYLYCMDKQRGIPKCIGISIISVVICIQLQCREQNFIPPPPHIHQILKLPVSVFRFSEESGSIHFINGAKIVNMNDFFVCFTYLQTSVYITYTKHRLSKLTTTKSPVTICVSRHRGSLYIADVKSILLVAIYSSAIDWLLFTDLLLQTCMYFSLYLEVCWDAPRKLKTSHFIGSPVFLYSFSVQRVLIYFVCMSHFRKQ